MLDFTPLISVQTKNQLKKTLQSTQTI